MMKKEIELCPECGAKVKEAIEKYDGLTEGSFHWSMKKLLKELGIE